MTQPVTIDVGQPTLASDFDAYENATAGWVAWNPTLTNLTLGNGTVVAVYRRVGQTVDFRFKFTLGSTSAVGSSPMFTPPYAANTTNFGQDDVVGTASMLNAAVALFSGVIWVNGSSFQLGVTGTSSTYATKVDITSTIPFTWGTADVLAATGIYTAA